MWTAKTMSPIAQTLGIWVVLGLGMGIVSAVWAGASEPLMPGGLPIEPGGRSEDVEDTSDTSMVDGRDLLVDPIVVPDPAPDVLAFHEESRWLWCLSWALRLAIPASVFFSGFSARIRDLAWSWGRSWYLALVIYLTVYLSLEYVLRFPLSYYAGYVRLHAYDLSNQSLDRWLVQSLKGLGLTLGGAWVFGWIPMALIRKSPRRWWLWLGLLSFPYLAFLVLVTPIMIDPLFHEYVPLANDELRERIAVLADRSGIADAEIYQVNMSEDTKTVNAYVTGLGFSHRIVFWDTALERLADDELLAVVGHEIGHYVLGHVTLAVLGAPLGILLALFVIDRLARSWLARCRGRTVGTSDPEVGQSHDPDGGPRLDDFASIPMLLLVFALVSFVSLPGQNAISRWSERQADLYALELTRDNRAVASAFATLQRENLSLPRPGWFDRIFRWTHPPLAERIEQANRYHPWLEEPPGPLLFPWITEEPTRLSQK